MVNQIIYLYLHRTFKAKCGMMNCIITLSLIFNLNVAIDNPITDIKCATIDRSLDFNSSININMIFSVKVVKAKIFNKISVITIRLNYHYYNPIINNDDNVDTLEDRIRSPTLYN